MFTRVLFLLLISLPVLAQQDPALMPWPKDIVNTVGSFRIDKDFALQISGPSDKNLNNYASRFLNRLSARVGMFFPSADQSTFNTSSPVQVLYDEIHSVDIGMDESYELEILPGGIILKAQSQIGVMRGLETLLQLVAFDNKGAYFSGYRIKDTPRFAWRGLLLDVCRNWMPLEVVLRNLNGMAAVKLNVLHLHLTEDQGFRIESKKYPKLHELGSEGNYFTQEEIKTIIHYATERGIRVVPEFDIPGHATSWFIGYPELASQPGPYQIKTTFGVHDPTMDPSKEYTYEFLNNFLTEMAQLFPDEFMHIGGDENNGKQWDANPKIQQFMIENGLDNNHQLQAYFNFRLSEILAKNNKRMVGWDEIMDEDLPQNIVIQSWRGKEALIEAAEAGYDGLLSNGYYIDLVQSTSVHYLNDPLPADVRISADARRHILGGEATMWSEIVSPETVDSRIWPRTAAIAERFWSAQEVRDVNSMYTRLKEISVQLEEHGLTHIKNYGMMIRRIAGEENEACLRAVLDFVEPIEGYQRKKPSKNMPLSRFPDIARPDALPAREFNLLVKEYIKSPEPYLKEEIKEQLLIWVDNNKKFSRIGDSNPIVKEALPLSTDLSNVAVIGLQALSNTVAHDSNWKSGALNSIELATSPKAECEIKVLTGIKELVNQAE